MSFLKNYFGEFDQNFVLRLLFTIFTIALIIGASDTLAAETTTGGSTAPNDVFGTSLCNVVKLLRGNIAKAVGIIAVFVMGVMVVQGNMKWPTGLLFACGLILIFKAPGIVDLISGETTGSTALCGA